MSESVTEIIVARARRKEPMAPMVLASVVAHSVVFGAALLFSVAAESAPPPKVFVVSFPGGPGPKTGGANAMGGRAVERVAPPEPKAVERPPAVTPPKMTLPDPVKKPQPREERTTTRTETAVVPKPQTTGEEIRAGSTKVDTGVKGTGFGISSGGGRGQNQLKLDVTDFCCQEYIDLMQQQIDSVWMKDQGRPGTSVIRFTINRDGSVTNAVVERTSGFGPLDYAAQLAVQRAKLPPLPTRFRESTLGVSLTFIYER